MATARATFHHALGTVQHGQELADDHPIVAAVPHLFDREPTSTTDEPKPRPKRKG